MKPFLCSIILAFSVVFFFSSSLPVSANAYSLSFYSAHLRVEAAGASALSGLWIAPTVPGDLSAVTQNWDLPPAADAASSALHLDLAWPQTAAPNVSTWIYALVAPFPTVTDGVSSYELRSAWIGSIPGPFAGRPLLMEASTLAALTVLWGAPASGSVRVVPADQLLQTAWSGMPSWAIVPFEALDPRWKVLAIDGNLPIHKDFNPNVYPLAIRYSLTCATPCNVSPLPSLPEGNRDASKMTVMILTGTTALVRDIAFTMERKGVTYPGSSIRDWLRDADILHVSNEASFDPNCPPPNPDESRFYCSNPKYIGLLDDVGVDVVELTGNHNMDNGASSALYSLDLYKQHGIKTYGGGANLADASRPLLLEDHGNKFAFIGCNAAPPPEAWAATNSPGAYPCDYNYITKEIQQLRAQGYLPIMTFQYKEAYSPVAMPWQQIDFRNIAKAGAVIVSGSQAHFPLNMEFYNGAFIHYGLGNLFFDQMGLIPPVPGIRREFIDRHIFYDGRYISTELLTTMLVDYSRPRPMTPDERAAFLQEYFIHSGWLPEDSVLTLNPTPTPTLIPLSLPLPSGTLSGSTAGTPTSLP